MRDLTTGNPLRQILLFSVPVLIGNLFQELYSLVDTIIVGQILGTDSLAAVGATGSVAWMVQGFCIGMTTGCAIYTAQRVGAKDPDGVRRSITTHAVIVTALALVLTVVFALLARPILTVMNTPDNVLDEAVIYLRIIYLGIPGVLLYNMLACTMRSLGDSRTPLYFLILSSLLNIVCDFLFVLGLHMGVAGAAIATIGAQYISGIACLIFVVIRMPQMHVHRRDWRISRSDIYRHVRLGVPTGLQFTITAVGGVVLQIVLNGFGADAVAGYTVYNRVNSLCMNPLITLGVSLSTFVGQNRGAGKYRRIRKGVHEILFVDMALGAVIGIAAIVFCRPLIGCFITLEGNDAVIAYARSAIIWSYSFYFILAALFIYRNALQGLGDAPATLIGALMELAVRVVVPIGLGSVIGYTAISIASPVAWFMCCIPLISIYYWRMRKLLKEHPVDPA